MGKLSIDQEKALLERITASNEAMAEQQINLLTLTIGTTDKAVLKSYEQSISQLGAVRQGNVKLIDQIARALS